MAYTISQWPDSVLKKEIETLPMDTANAILVMLRAMRKRGPFLDEYKPKRLSGHLRGLIQVPMKLKGEQIRILYSVHGSQIVILHVFKKTSPQVQTRGYQKALKRNSTVKIILKDKSSGLTSIN